MSEREMSNARDDPAVVFFVMLGAFSAAALRAYLDAGGQIRAVCLPTAAPAGIVRGAWRPLPSSRWSSTHTLLPSAAPSSVLALATERGIPAYEIADTRDHATLVLFASLRATVACVACWPKRIPASLRAAFPLGMLNLHPSLLPLHRGPDPLFWTLHYGDPTAGITIHLMDDSIDTGPILAQRAVELQDGLTGLELDIRCAAAGGQLLASTVRELAAGRCQMRPQDRDAGGYEPAPQPSDFIVTGERSARWVFNFVRAAQYWGGPVIVECDGDRKPVRDALSYDPYATLEVPCRQLGSELLLRCQPGVVRMSVA
jgi:methionyl-tRNA formyltransferase